MFFEFRYAKKSGKNYKISSSSEIFADIDCYALEYAKNIVASATGSAKTDISLNLGIPEEIIKLIG